ncbi:MAG: helix-turn-helix transcriptional regulator [Uliginosibacterium sp.]|nr:helix-turn-helix transcriptional regulator [Uliginosibacterium sp.]MBK9393339.1 helix-turn-helix transcriptional regulator [Uliginosibacterium sp.]MBK9616284.1 helix-turn-helix transcriptional regulator [Uliginosibacterium sp.]
MTKLDSAAGEIDLATSPDPDEILKALASPARREMLAWLKSPAEAFPTQAHPFEMGVCAGKIFEKSGLSHSTVSAHLACLSRAGLVVTRKVGQWIFYSRNEAVIAAFVRQMQQDL